MSGGSTWGKVFPGGEKSFCPVYFQFLFTFNSLTGLREEKAGYGRLGSSPCSQIRFVSHEKKLSVDSLNRWFSLKKEAYEELAEFSLSQGH